MDFIITPDKNFLRVTNATTDELNQLSVGLTKYVKDWKFKRKKSYGHWDGKIKFMDASHRIPIGLWSNVQRMCNEYGFQFNIEDTGDLLYDSNFDEVDFDKFVEEMFRNHDKKPYDYQIIAAKKILRWKRCIAELATSAGKTLIMYLVFSYLLRKKTIKKMLIIVPRTALVLQAAENFEDFSMDKKMLKYKVQLLGGGRERNRQDVQLMIGTYQTLSKMSPELFYDVDVVCVDECHTSSTTSVKKVLSMCMNATIRFGLSGTTKITKEDDAETYTMISLLGPLVEKVSGRYLTDNGYATPINIKMVVLDYLDAEMKQNLFKLRLRLRAQKTPDDKGANVGSKLLSIEQQMITENKKRMQFICNFIPKLAKNSLVLFKDIKNGYGKRVHHRLKKILPENYEVFYIDGGTDEKSREIYKKRMDLKDGRQRILVASFGTFSTGVSINAINNVIFLESYKSEVIVKQSIGRGMRKNADKHVVNIIDFVDDFSVNGWENYTLRHAYEREQIYKKEKYQYKKLKIKL